MRAEDGEMKISVLNKSARNFRQKAGEPLTTNHELEYLDEFFLSWLRLGCTFAPGHYRGDTLFSVESFMCADSVILRAEYSMEKMREFVGIFDGLIFLGNVRYDFTDYLFAVVKIDEKICPVEYFRTCQKLAEQYGCDYVTRFPFIEKLRLTDEQIEAGLNRRRR